MSYLDQKIYVQNSGNAWGYKTVDGVTRFEVRSGDQWEQDGVLPKERSEIATTQKLQFGKTYEISFSMLIEAGAKNTADWMTLVQVQSTFDKGEAGHSPAFALEMVGDKMRVVTRDSSAFLSTAADTSYVRHYTDKADIQRDKWYDFKIEIKLDAFGGGSLEVVRDGQVLCTYEGALGFNDLVGSYLKLGVYRESSPENFAVNFRDVEVEAVNAPLKITSGGGAGATKVTVLENTLDVTKVVAVDPEGVAPIYSIAGGADAASFTIDKVTGALRFLSAPDYEAPKAAGGGNNYAVVVRASDGKNAVDQTITVQVADVAEPAKSTKTVQAFNVSHYDAGWKFASSEVSTVAVRTEASKIVTEHWSGGRLLSASVETERNGKTVVEFFDGNWKATGAEVTTHGTKTVTEYYDASWKFVSADVLRVTNGKMVAEHYDSQWRFTGADVGIDKGATSVIEYRDANWRMSGADVLRTEAGKIVTEHYNDKWVFTGSEISTMPTSSASALHDPMVDWLLA